MKLNAFHPSSRSSVAFARGKLGECGGKFQSQTFFVDILAPFVHCSTLTVFKSR